MTPSRRTFLAALAAAPLAALAPWRPAALTDDGVRSYALGLLRRLETRILYPPLVRHADGRHETLEASRDLVDLYRVLSRELVPRRHVKQHPAAS